MTEQEATDKLEVLVGSINGCFRLMRIDTGAVQSSGGKPVLAAELFIRRAQRDGYSDEAITHYLDNIR